MSSISGSTQPDTAQGDASQGGESGISECRYGGALRRGYGGYFV